LTTYSTAFIKSLPHTTGVISDEMSICTSVRLSPKVRTKTPFSQKNETIQCSGHCCRLSHIGPW